MGVRLPGWDRAWDFLERFKQFFLFSQHAVDAETYISLRGLGAGSLPVTNLPKSAEYWRIRFRLVSRFWSAGC